MNDEKLRKEIMQLKRKGMDNKDIASELDIPLPVVLRILKKRKENKIGGLNEQEQSAS